MIDSIVMVVALSTVGWGNEGLRQHPEPWQNIKLYLKLNLFFCELFNFFFIIQRWLQRFFWWAAQPWHPDFDLLCWYWRHHPSRHHSAGKLLPWKHEDCFQFSQIWWTGRPPFIFSFSRLPWVKSKHEFRILFTREKVVRKVETWSTVNRWDQSRVVNGLRKHIVSVSNYKFTLFIVN